MKQLLLKNLHWIFIALGAYYFITYFNNKDQLYLTNGLLFIVIGLLILINPLKYLKRKPTAKSVINPPQPTSSRKRTLEPEQPKEIIKSYVAGTSYRQTNIKRLIRYLFENATLDRFDGIKNSEIKETLSRYYEIPLTELPAWVEFDKENEYNPKAIKVMCDEYFIGFIPEDDLDDVYALLDKYEESKMWVTFKGGKYKEYDDLEEEFISGETDISCDYTIRFY